MKTETIICCKTKSVWLPLPFLCFLPELSIFAAMSITIKILLLVSICFASGLTYSQNRSTGSGSSRQGRAQGGSSQSNSKKSESSSSRKNSGQNDNTKGGKTTGVAKDTIVFKMKTFQLQNGYTQLKESKLDTIFADYQTYNPLLKKSLSAQTLGNLGAPAQGNDYFERSIDSKEFLFLQNYRPFGKWPDNIQFFNTTKPFTQLEYGQWFSNKPKGESWLKVFQTQNINPSLNFGFSYFSISSQGKYLNQEAKDNSLNFFGSYNIDRYDLWFMIGKNKFTNQENGGLLFPKDIENPDLKPENLPVWLDGTSAEMKNSYGVIAHQFKFGKWIEVKDKKEIFQKFIPRFALMHTMEFTDNSRYFSEVEPNPYYDFSDSRGTVYFYGEGHIPYIKDTKGTALLPSTQDKSGMKRVTNMFYIKAVEAPDRKYTFGKQAYIGVDLINVYFPRKELIYTPGIMQPPLGLIQSDKLTNTFVGGSIFRSEGKFWNYNATGRYYIQGYRFADFEMEGHIEKPIRTAKDTSFFRINASMTNSTPDYFYNHFYSNHFEWENNFNKTYELRLGAVYDNPFRKFKASLKYSIINNFVYWNEKSMPAQANSEFSVVQVFLNKDFKFGGLNILNSVLFQKSTTEVYLHIPQVSTRNTVFIEGLLSKVLTFQFGLDLRYDTQYYADYYSPALGMFYVQNNEKIGNYPWLDVFINLKIKRTRFYVKYANAGTKIVRRGYYTTPGYAAQVAATCFGLSWTFYD